jgi:hypothetical protein
MLKIKTTADVVHPAEIVSSMENFLEIATAAIACDGISPTNHPCSQSVTYLHRLYWKRYSKKDASKNVP